MLVVCFFESDGMEFMNILCRNCQVSSHITFKLSYENGVKLWLTHSSTKFFNFNKFINNIDPDVFLTNP